jgi:hypothetical protein
MPVSPLEGKSAGVPFLVSAGIVYEIIAAACSSPQTAEINADKRAETLMKWVNIGLAESVLFIVIAASVDPGHAKPIIAGGALAGGIMYISYVHALKSGLANSQEGTES